jgi:hypothetical protein
LPSAEYDGARIDYARFTVNEDRNLTLLDIAGREELLEHRASTPDGNHYAVLCNGNRLLLAGEEVPGFVLGLFVAAGRDLAPIAYRHGLPRSA